MPTTRSNKPGTEKKTKTTIEGHKSTLTDTTMDAKDLPLHVDHQHSMVDENLFLKIWEKIIVKEKEGSKMKKRTKEKEIEKEGRRPG